MALHLIALQAAAYTKYLYNLYFFLLSFLLPFLHANMQTCMHTSHVLYTSHTLKHCMFPDIHACYIHTTTTRAATTTATGAAEHHGRNGKKEKKTRSPKDVKLFCPFSSLSTSLQDRKTSKPRQALLLPISRPRPTARCKTRSKKIRGDSTRLDRIERPTNRTGR